MTSSTLSQQSNTQTKSWSVSAVWQRLTIPSSEVLEPERRRRARLLSSMLLIIVPLIVITSFVAVPLIDPTQNPLSTPIPYVALAAAAVLSLAYLLSRTAKFAIGGVILVSTFSVATFAVILIDPTVNVKDMIVYLTTAILLGSILLSLRDTLIISVLNILAIVILPFAVPSITVDVVIPSVAYVVVTLIIILVAAVIRQRDLEQIEQQSQQLAAAVEQAHMANKLKDQFLATMSHELRTPLNAIIGFAEIMMMGLAGELSAEGLHATDRIHRNSERLLDLIDDILDISKIEAGRIDIINRPLMARELLGNIELNLKPAAIEKGLEFRTQLDPALPAQLVGDTQRLEQIITNLVSNAIKFTDRGHVSVVLKPAGDKKWQIEVTDTGVGIPAHALEFIFEKFRQVDGSSRRAFGGTGLGLAIVKELALLMDGNVKAQSQIGIGSTFTVTLPLIEDRTKN